MRIISGLYKGRTVAMPDGEPVRPMQEKLRHALFNILVWQVEGARVLDLYAGSGSLSLEALSRGAASATLVEMNPGVLRVLRENIESLGVAGRCTLIPGDAHGIVPMLKAKNQQFDLILADPPFKFFKSPAEFRKFADLLDELKASGVLAEGGTGVLEMPRKSAAELAFKHCQIQDRRDYGEVSLVFYR